MSKEKCIPVEIGYKERLDVLPDLQQIHLHESDGFEYAVLYFTHVSQVTKLIKALQEMRDSFINDIK